MMKYHVPYYYRQFSCIGGACEDTCCGGWKIGIDEDSMEIYRNTPGEFGRKLQEGIDPDEGCFRLKERRCTFLDQEGLCEIYKELGKEHMCKDCRRYPRHMEDYGPLREISLSLSCPEAARIILGDERQCDVKTRWKGKCRNNHRYQKAPWTDLNWILQARQTMINIVKDRAIPWEQRLAMITAYANDLQNRWYVIQNEKADDVQSACMEKEERRLSARYSSCGAAERFAEKLAAYQDRSHEQMIRINAWMREAQDLEPVLDHWSAKQQRVCTRLYHNLGTHGYAKLIQEYDQAESSLELERENLAIYFIQTYVAGALYDGDFLDKVILVVFCTLLIREWCRYRYSITGVLDRGTMAAAAYRCSREIENSDANLDMLESMFLENPLFELKSILTVLCGSLMNTSSKSFK